MSKQIQVPDDIYIRLKGHADGDYRSLGKQIELILDYYEGIEKLKPRSLGELIHEERPVDEHIPLGLNDAVRKNFAFDPSGKVVTPNPEDDVESKCCKLKAPCKHWVFNDGEWRNTLSGRTKEVE